jgi:hypothetical protein
VWPFKSKSSLTASALHGRWFRAIVPEGHASLESFEAGITSEEEARLPKTMEKLAMDGVERIYQVRRVELEPDRSTLAYLDGLLDAEMLHKLTLEQDPTHARNLFRVVCTEFGCIVGEIFVRAGKGHWELRRAPNHWRSTLRLSNGERYDPFLAVIRQLSDEREPGGLARAFDSV